MTVGFYTAVSLDFESDMLVTITGIATQFCSFFPILLPGTCLANGASNWLKVCDGEEKDMKLLSRVPNSTERLAGLGRQLTEQYNVR